MYSTKEKACSITVAFHLDNRKLEPPYIIESYSISRFKGRLNFDPWLLPWPHWDALTYGVSKGVIQDPLGSIFGILRESRIVQELWAQKKCQNL